MPGGRPRKDDNPTPEIAARRARSRERWPSDSRNGTYNAWRNMKIRGGVNSEGDHNAKRHAAYKDVTVALELQTWAGFYAVMGDRPDGMSLDRIDPNKGYEVDNIRWASDIQQANNKRMRPEKKLAAIAALEIEVEQSTERIRSMKETR